MRKTNTTEIAIAETSKSTTSTQTPIEIALKIDENGMTTASQLYSFFRIRSFQFFKMVYS